MQLPEKLQKKLDKRVNEKSLRHLTSRSDMVDFSSNDYLGLSSCAKTFNQAHQYLLDRNLYENGSTGSRLLSGNHDLYNVVEDKIKEIHQSPAALIYNSGYDANIGLLSCIATRDDVILYDQLIHASIRDALQLSQAKSFAFKHNDLQHLQTKLIKHSQGTVNKTVYVVTESVFSMDGDAPDLKQMLDLCDQSGARLILDEAHALGVFGWGLAQQLGLHERLFARIMTFGKALGCHGATILGSQSLIHYLINFSRSFIYTTALPPHSLSTILSAYTSLQKIIDDSTMNELVENIKYFRQTYKTLGLTPYFIDSHSAIQSCVISENKGVKSLAKILQQQGYDVKPILAPTVPKGQERLRFCLHSFNTKSEIDRVLEILKKQR